MTRWFFSLGIIGLTFMFAIALAAEFLLPPRPLTLGADLQQFGFEACDLPCYAGITVGETNSDDVPALIAQYVGGRGRVLMDDLPPLQTANGDVLSNEGTLYTFQREALYRPFNAAIMTREDLVTSIQLNGLVQLDALLEDLGAPTCADYSQQTSTSQSMRLYWLLDDNQIMITAAIPIFQREWGFKSFSLGVNIIYVPGSPYMLPPESLSGDWCDPHSWIGFARINQYAQREG